METTPANSIEGDSPERDKRARILQGALSVFLAYGFSRTTMDDIARAVGMSRPALYLVFRNKTDIFRAGAAMMLEQSLETAARILRDDDGFVDRMMRAIDTALLSMMRNIAASPHGGELLDLKTSIAADVAQRWRQELGRHVCRAIADEAMRRDLDLESRGLSALVLADMLLDGLEGAKARTPDPDQQLQAVRGLVTVIDLVLR